MSEEQHISPLLTDLYQITMAYAYWKSGRHMQKASFDLFFRKNPFQGEFTVFAGLAEVLNFMEDYKITDKHIAYLKTILPNADPGFFLWLRDGLNLKDITVYAPLEGTVMFPRVPLLRMEGPIAACQLLETTLLNLVNFASLVCTNAARYRLIAGDQKFLLEFGLRRAQGPNGAMTASRYSFIGGFDGSSNVLAGYLNDIPISGTHAHAFITSFTGFEDISDERKKEKVGTGTKSFFDMCIDNRETVGAQNTNEGELAAFIDYCLNFPEGGLCLVDSYDTVDSGIPNFLAVALALAQCGLPPKGIRLDSGDLAYLSTCARKAFISLDEKVGEILPGFKFSKMNVVASNDINENTLASIELQGHSIDTFGIGTNLVTCQAQPALGCVYKLVEIEGKPRIKLSQEIEKVTLPSRKECYRLVGKGGVALLDFMAGKDEEAPQALDRVLCRHPFIPKKRAYVAPAKVMPLHVCVFKDGKATPESKHDRSLREIRQYVKEQLAIIRPDIKRTVNPTPYKVSVSDSLFTELHDLWMKESPIAEMS